jgi:hypothetical protein
MKLATRPVAEGSGVNVRGELAHKLADVQALVGGAGGANVVLAHHPGGQTGSVAGAAAAWVGEAGGTAGVDAGGGKVRRIEVLLAEYESEAGGIGGELVCGSVADCIDCR